MRETNRVIPAAQLTSRQILYTYAGVRPLPFVSDTDEPSITRRHFIRELPGIENLLSIVGGKLTTYRSLAAATVAQIFQKLRRQAPPCTTHRLPLPGAAAANFAAFCQEFKQRSGLRQATADRWLRIYGTRASLLSELMMADRSLAEVCDEETGALAAEVVFAFKHELAQTLVDCLFRRTMIGLNSDLGLKACEVAARVTRRHLGWSESRVAQQLAAYHDSVARLGGVKRV